MYKYRRQAGVGLLELMLAVGIIGLITVMTINYFSVSKNKTLVSAGIQQIQDIIGALSGLPDPEKSAGGVRGYLTKAISLSGSIPKQYVDSTSGYQFIKSPWGGTATYTIQYNGGVPPTASIKSSKLPNYACKSLEVQFKNASGVKSADCNTNNKITIKVYIVNNQDVNIPDS